jgi:hypothetical protein
MCYVIPILLGLPQTSHVSQGEDVVSLFDYEGAVLQKTLLAFFPKCRLQEPCTDQLAWGGNKVKETAALGNATNADWMYCTLHEGCLRGSIL